MKKWIPLLLAAIAVGALAGCSGASDSNVPSDATTTKPATTEPTTAPEAKPATP